MNAIDLYGLESVDFEGKLDNTISILQSSNEIYPGKIIQASSLSSEDMIITDICYRHKLPIPVGIIDTGRLHLSTVKLIDIIRKKYNLEIKIYYPDPDDISEFITKYGANSIYDSVDLRKLCCTIRKVKPLASMLENKDAWITGLRRGQSNNRENISFVEKNNKIKINPLADWSLQDVWFYIKKYNVPYNVLHDYFYISIGCDPCTRPIAPNEDIRNGRWWWENRSTKECGLHE